MHRLQIIMFLLRFGVIFSLPLFLYHTFSYSSPFPLSFWLFLCIHKTNDFKESNIVNGTWDYFKFSRIILIHTLHNNTIGVQHSMCYHKKMIVSKEKYRQNVVWSRAGCIDIKRLYDARSLEIRSSSMNQMKSVFFFCCSPITRMSTRSLTLW